MAFTEDSYTESIGITGDLSVDNIKIDGTTIGHKTNTDLITFDATGVTIGQSGDKLGFFGDSGNVQKTGWSIDDGITNRSYNAQDGSLTLPGLGHVVATLVADLKSYGLID